MQITDPPHKETDLMTGNLLRYRDPDPCAPADLRSPRTIGTGGWDAFRTVFAGDCGTIYAITNNDNLLRYPDPDPCTPADLHSPVTIGTGGWDAFRIVFAGGCSAVYAITN